MGKQRMIRIRRTRRRMRLMQEKVDGNGQRNRMTHKVFGCISDSEGRANKGEGDNEGDRCKWVGTLRNGMTRSRWRPL